jgi:hypothetical protein
MRSADHCSFLPTNASVFLRVLAVMSFFYVRALERDLCYQRGRNASPGLPSQACQKTFIRWRREKWRERRGLGCGRGVQRTRWFC